MVLALNSGSSSLNFGLNRIESSIPKMLFSGEVESTGGPAAKFWVKNENGEVLGSELAHFRNSAGRGRTHRKVSRGC
jgi:acetate kinase